MLFLLRFRIGQRNIKKQNREPTASSTRSEMETQTVVRFQDNLDNQTTDEEEEDEDEETSTRYCKRYCSTYGALREGCWSGRVGMDPRRAEDWNRVFLLVSVAGLFVDPLFFYALSISRAYMCVFVDGWLAIAVTVLRCAVDAFHLWNMWLHLKLRLNGAGIASVWSKSLLFDLFVILPLPQIAVWVGAPMLLKRGSTNTVTTVFLTIFVFQYLPKIYHAVCILRRMQSRTGYIFGTIWWGFALNMLAYFVASHAAGACWFLLGFQRAARCLRDQCRLIPGCNPHRMLASQHRPIYYGDDGAFSTDPARLAWAANTYARSTCLDHNDSYDYGAYGWVIYLVANDNRFEKILMPIFWGLMTMSTFGNLAATAEWMESVFVIVVLTSGLLLVTMLIGNIKVFLHATTSKKQGMQLRMRSLEWWMKKRKLPPDLKQRVRNYEWQKWAAMRGVDECDIISTLPQGLRRDIKYHLCLDLVRQVPLFQHMDELVLENICDRAKSLIFTKGETITKEGDPVKRMLFIVRGHLHSSQVLREGVKSSCMLGPGNFSGDELLSWCLRRPFVDRLPPSSSTLVTLETTEALELEAEDVKYVTQHFRYTFVNEKVRRSARYYSPGWRTWAAVAIQLAWRRHKHRLTLTSLSFIRPRRPLSRSSSLGEDRLRLYAALLTSPKPNPHDFDF